MVQCPICQKALIGRQKVACSGRHRAEVSRRRKVAQAKAPIERALVELLARAEDLGRAPEGAREVLRGDVGSGGG